MNAPKIWIYKDKATGEGKGEATITYEDEEAAQAAINWYNGKISLELLVLEIIYRSSVTFRQRSSLKCRENLFGYSTCYEFWWSRWIPWPWWLPWSR